MLPRVPGAGTACMSRADLEGCNTCLTRGRGLAAGSGAVLASSELNCGRGSSGVLLNFYFCMKYKYHSLHQEIIFHRESVAFNLQRSFYDLR